MRHGKVHRKLNRTAEHRRAMFANMCACADQARADRHHAAEGQGAAADRREAGDARQEGRPRHAPSGDQRDARPGSGPKAVRRARHPLQGPPGRLYPHHQGRLSLWRQRADGGDRIRRPRRRCQGPRIPARCRKRPRKRPDYRRDRLQKRRLVRRFFVGRPPSCAGRRLRSRRWSWIQRQRRCGRGWTQDHHGCLNKKSRSTLDTQRPSAHE